MIKRMMTAMVVMVVTSCSYAQVKNVGSFSRLKVYDQLKVELVPSNEYKAEITGKNAQEVTFVNSGSELKVRMATVKLMQGDDTKIIIYYKSINDIQASQGSTITGSSVLKSNAINLVSNEGSVIDIAADTAHLTAKVNTGGLIALKGKSTSQDIIVNAGGKFHAKAFETEDTKVTVNAGGEAIVNASKDVSSTVRAGGNIDIYGNPEQRHEKKIIGGKITYK